MNKNSLPYTSHISTGAFIAYFFIYSFFPYKVDVIKHLCILTAIGCWMTRVIYEKKVFFTKTSLNIPILLLLTWSLIASFCSADTLYSIQTLQHNHLAYSIIFFCMVNTVHGLRHVRYIVCAMLITCGLICMYGLYGYYTGIPFHSKRFIATFEYHSRAAKYISLLLPIAVSLFFWHKSKFIRTLLVILACGCSFAMILTMNRTSWVAIFLTMIFIGFATQKKLLMFIFIGSCATIVFILPSQFITHAKTIVQVNKFFNSHEILGERVLCWRASAAIIKDHPVFGIGLGKKIFREAYQQYGKDIKDSDKQLQAYMAQKQHGKAKAKSKRNFGELEKLSTAHNIFLHICVESGIIGLMIFLWLFITVFSKAIKSWRNAEPGYVKALLMGITASLIAIFLHGITDSFWKKPEAIFLWYIIGLLFVIINGTELQTKEEPLKP